MNGKRTYSKRYWLGRLLGLVALVCIGTGAKAQNNPYVDEKLFHMGFQLNVNFMSYGIENTILPTGQPYVAPTMDKPLYARVSSLLPGFGVAFVMDVRLCKYLNLRITPGLDFAQRTINYAYADGTKYEGFAVGADRISQMNLLCIPVTVPIYLKWSGARERNHRVYALIGGGITFNVNTGKVDDYVQFKKLDGFVEGGFGCDFYFPWFKLCPQLTYRVGLANQIMQLSEYPNPLPEQQIFTGPIDKMLNRSIVLTFNFE